MMMVYSCFSNVIGDSSFSLNLTSAIVDGLKCPISTDYLFWNLYLDSDDNIQNILSFDEVENYNVIKRFRVKLSKNNVIKVPVIVGYLFSFSKKDSVKLEHEIIDDKSFINVTPFKKTVNFHEVRDEIVLLDESKLIFKKNIKRIVFPRKLRKEFNIGADDWLVLSVYRDSLNELYVDFVKLEDLINEKFDNGDTLLYRTLEQLTVTATAYYLIPDDYLVNLLSIDTFTYAKWKVLFDKHDDFRLEFE